MWKLGGKEMNIDIILEKGERVVIDLGVKIVTINYNGEQTVRLPIINVGESFIIRNESTEEIVVK